MYKNYIGWFTLRICYIKQTDKPSTLFLKILQNIKYIFNIIDIKYDNNKKIYIIPILKHKKIKKNKLKKIVRRLNKKLRYNDIQEIALSEYLEEIDELKNELKLNGDIKILNGNRLFNYLIEEIVDYIANINNIRIDKLYMSILADNINDITLNNILLLAKKVKLLNIITNNISRLKNIEEYLYNEFGIMIKISNNKRKDLLKSNIIINMDYQEELLNGYNINNKAIIVNVNEDVSIKSKKFNGININSFEINIPKDKKIMNFRDEIAYESMIYGDFDSVKSILKKDHVTIKNLIGINGIIGKSEFINLLDKNKIVE